MPSSNSVLVFDTAQNAPLKPKESFSEQKTTILLLKQLSLPLLLLLMPKKNSVESLTWKTALIRDALASSPNHHARSLVLFARCERQHGGCSCVDVALVDGSAGLIDAIFRKNFFVLAAELKSEICAHTLFGKSDSSTYGQRISDAGKIDHL
jgi:hypothetical protein